MKVGMENQRVLYRFFGRGGGLIQTSLIVTIQKRGKKDMYGLLDESTSIDCLMAKQLDFLEQKHSSNIMPNNQELSLIDLQFVTQRLQERVLNSIGVAQRCTIEHSLLQGKDPKISFILLWMNVLVLQLLAECLSLYFKYSWSHTTSVHMHTNFVIVCTI